MSVIQHKSQRVAILIDTQNLYHSAKNLYNARVNFQQVLSDSLGDRTLIRAIAYLISTESGEEEGFFDALLSMGIETKTKDLLIYSGGNKKGDWDIGITVDAIRIANKVDTIVLVTGDGDFVPLIEHLKSLGIQIEVVSFGKSSSSKLIESAEAFLDLCIDYDKYLLSYTKNKINKNPRKYKSLENKKNRTSGNSLKVKNTETIQNVPNQTKKPEDTNSIHDINNADNKIITKRNSKPKKTYNKKQAF